MTIIQFQVNVSKMVIQRSLLFSFAILIEAMRTCQADMYAGKWDGDIHAKLLYSGFTKISCHR